MIVGEFAFRVARLCGTHVFSGNYDHDRHSSDNGNWRYLYRQCLGKH